MNEKNATALLSALHEAMNDDPRATLDAIVAALQGAVGDPEDAPPELVDLTVTATIALGDLFAALTGEGRGRDAPAATLDPAEEPEPLHTSDEQCSLGPDDVCTACGVYHGDPCWACRARGFHLLECGDRGPVTPLRSAQ